MKKASVKEQAVGVRIHSESVEHLPAAKIKGYARNARTHSETQIAGLVKLITELGFTNPLLIDEKNEIIAGHGRFEAAKQLGIDPIPCIRVRGLSQNQIRALRLADNKIQESGGWDEGLLRAELGELQAAKFDLSLTGFALSELNVFGGGIGESNAGAGGEESKKIGSLKDRFFAVPFSVLNAREGSWQERKRAWLALGIQSEVGRGENALALSPMMLGVHDEEGRARIHATQRDFRGKKARADAKRKVDAKG